MENIIKFFNEKGSVQFMDERCFVNKGCNGRIIRTIPKRHSYFNINNETYELKEIDIKFLSEGDMILVFTSTGTDYYELEYDKDIQELIYKKDSFGYHGVNSLFNDVRVKKVKVRNDLFVPAYAQDDSYNSNASTLIEQISTLSSGTIATLIKSDMYSYIDSVIDRFREYSKNLPVSYKWQSAWKVFKDSDEYLDVLKNFK